MNGEWIGCFTEEIMPMEAIIAEPKQIKGGKRVFNAVEFRRRLFLQLIPAKRVPLGVPVTYWEDLAVVARIMISKDENEVRSAIVTDEVLEAVNMTQETLFEEALENAAKIAPLSIINLQEVFSDNEVSNQEKENKQPTSHGCKQEPVLYVATCNQGIYGAICILYPDFVEKAEEICGGGFYILPASVHEVMLVSDCVEMQCDQLKSMVMEINQSTLEEWEVLGDSIYHYNMQRKCIEKCC